MHYTQLFRKLREARGLTLEALAKLARRHRNTVINVESGRPVKFKTIAELMVKMGYGTKSAEMKAIALLWLEAVSGIPFSQPETEAGARKAVAGYQASARQAARQLGRKRSRGRDSTVGGDRAAGLRRPQSRQCLGHRSQNLRGLATDLRRCGRKELPEREVAEDSRSPPLTGRAGRAGRPASSPGAWQA